MVVSSWVSGGILVLAIAVAAIAVVVLDRPNGRWGRQTRSRFLLGVPWGTLVVACFVLSVYLFFQHGLSDWSDPLVLPYRSWSYLYPTGWLVAGFAHGSPGHLVGNLTGTLVLAPLAEYAWGHFPDERGSQSFASWRTNPWVRAFVVFPVVVLLVGLATSLFALGPVIGFSGAVFAFAGFAIVHYPLLTVGALLVTQVVRTALQSLLDPVLVATSSASAPAPPSWATVAVQGHALGFLLGIVLGRYVLSRRDRQPSAARLVGATLIFGVVQGLYLVYWFRGGGEYVLYRGVGVALVVVLALLVTLAVRASERPVVRSITRRGVAVTLLFLAVAALAGPAIVPNLVTVDDPDLGENAVAVEDYRITYDEEVRNELVYVGDIELFGESTAVETSGVIVASAERELWLTHTSKQRLAFDGSTTVKVGGPGWSETVQVQREGWELPGDETVYQVSVGERDRPVFVSEAKTASPRIDGRTVTLVPEGDEFVLTVEDETDERDSVPIPAAGETATAGGLTFERTVEEDGAVLTAERDGTRVEIARTESRGV